MSTSEAEQKAIRRLQPVQVDLLRILDGCRADMHEPDEQNVQATVVGTHLDNAINIGFGPPVWNDISTEFMVGITRWTGEYQDTRWFNLADLLAIARLADLGLER